MFTPPLTCALGSSSKSYFPVPIAAAHSSPQLIMLLLLPADASGETSLEVQELPSCSDDDDELDSHLAAAVQAVGAALSFPAPSAPLRCA